MATNFDKRCCNSHDFKNGFSWKKLLILALAILDEIKILQIIEALYRMAAWTKIIGWKLINLKFKYSYSWDIQKNWTIICLNA